LGDASAFVDCRGPNGGGDGDEKKKKKVVEKLFVQKG